MAITETRALPAQFIEDIGKDYAQQLTAATAAKLDTSKFAPQIAGQTALQQQATTLAGQGVGAYQPYVSAAGAQGTAAGTTLGGISPYISAAGAGLGAAGTELTGAGTAMAGVSPYLTGAAGLTGAPTSAQISDYMSPYQQDVIDTSLAEFDRQRQIQQQDIGTAAIGVGGYGGGRHGVAEAEFTAQSGRDRAALEAQLRQQGYGQAMGLKQQDLANRMGLAGAQQQYAGGLGALAGQRAGLGQAQLGLGQATGALAQQQLGLGQYQQGMAGLVPQLQRGDISTVGQVGAIDQAQAQAQLDATRETERLAAYEPLERLGMYGQGVTGLMGGYPAQYQFTAQPNASPLGTALGIGAAGAGIYRNIMGKGT